MEGLQSTVYFLQQELKTVRDENQQLKQINEQLSNGGHSRNINGDAHNNGNDNPTTTTTSSCIVNGNETTSANEEESSIIRTATKQSAKQSEIDEFNSTATITTPTTTLKVKSVNEMLLSNGDENNVVENANNCDNTNDLTDTTNGIGKRPLETSDANVVDGINPKRTRRTAAIVAMASIESDKKLNCVA